MIDCTCSGFRPPKQMAPIQQGSIRLLTWVGQSSWVGRVQSSMTVPRSPLGSVLRRTSKVVLGCSICKLGNCGWCMVVVPLHGWLGTVPMCRALFLGGDKTEGGQLVGWRSRSYCTTRPDIGTEVVDAKCVYNRHRIQVPVPDDHLGKCGIPVGWGAS